MLERPAQQRRNRECGGRSGAFECATFDNNGKGWAVNHEGQVFFTDSRGIGWTKISELPDFVGASQIEFLNDNDGWIRAFPGLWRTHDGGRSWQLTLSPRTDGVRGNPSGLSIIDRNTVVASGDDGQVYITTDGGSTWRIQAPVTGNVSYSDVWFADSKRGWLAGYEVVVAGENLRPLLLESSDGGETWRETDISDNKIIPASICFIGTRGWLAGNRRLGSEESVRLVGVLLHSTDGGENWNQVEFGSADSIVGKVRFSDNDHGWLVGRDDLYHTADAGKTWKPVLSLPPPG